MPPPLFSSQKKAQIAAVMRGFASSCRFITGSANRQRWGPRNEDKPEARNEARSEAKPEDADLHLLPDLPEDLDLDPAGNPSQPMEVQSDFVADFSLLRHRSVEAEPRDYSAERDRSFRMSLPRDHSVDADYSLARDYSMERPKPFKLVRKQNRR